MIVLVGVVGIALTRADQGAADPPPQPGNAATGAPGDHWHAAVAANVCGEWLTSPPEFEQVADNPNVRPGIHTHGDGFVHAHPFTRSEGGDNATFGKFLDYGGWLASEDSLELWVGPAAAPTATSWSNGDTCPADTPHAGKKGTVVWSVDCKARTGNPSEVKLLDQQVIAVGFLPKGEKLDVPPNASATPADDGSEAGPTDNEGCSTLGPGDVIPTTVAPIDTTPTTVATTPPSSTP